MKRKALRIALLLLCLSSGHALVAQDELEEALRQPLLQPEEAAEQHKAFVLSRITKLKLSESSDAWQQQAERLRRRLLDEVVFRGVPSEWRDAKPAVVWDEVIETEHGYRIRKLRFEALPGLWIPALLYEPSELDGVVPAVLNVNGHEKIGKSAEYKQLRCINLAKRGCLAMNLEWIGMGQLRTAGLSHNHLAKLDVCGRSGLSVFFLAMQRGLDVLLAHEHTDLERTAVTGLSGGGWQTIMLSSLDTRVRLAVPVAGHSALAQRVANTNSIGDLEQNPCDLASIADYVHLNAIMVPRPMLLIYNTHDSCCFVAHTVKPNTYEPVKPFYEQAGVADRLSYYENDVPGNHNYERDNREQLYRFLNVHFFDVDEQADEIASADEVRTHEELLVPLPDDNGDFHTLAKSLVGDLPKRDNGSLEERRQRLQQILRYHPQELSADLFTGPKELAGLTIRHLRLEANGEWVVPAMVVESETVERNMVVLADEGFASQAARIRELAESGARVLAVDPILIGQATPPGKLYQNAMLIATVGDRPLGIQAGQVAAAAQYFARVFVAEEVDIDAHGARSSLIARCAAAIDGGETIRGVETTGEADSLKEYLLPSASYDKTPEVYCFGLLEHFDVPQLKELGAK